ncbi:tyrosine-type recombinase/integrase [Nitrospira sp. T9]|uniref:tyrosine-type recombinase/integrase n=1 Tax=unclassified Nitrospira TaxID=2652172 RepID=UPI003F9BC6FB
MKKKKKKTPGVIERPAGSGKCYVRIKHRGKDRLIRVASEAQGKALQIRLRAEILESRYQPERVRPLTLKTWIDRCLEGTTNRDKQHEEQRTKYWSGVFGERYLTELTSEDIRHHQAKMLASGDWKPATVNRYLSALRRVLTLALNDGKILRHPMRGIKFLAEEQRDTYFSDEVLQKIHGLMEPQTWKEVHFAIETCLRASEQYSLKWADVNFESKYLTIPLSKSGKTRRVPLSEQALSILRSLDSLESAWVFPDPIDSLKSKNPYHAGDHLKRILRKAGLAGNWHLLRHTGATRRLLAGVDLVTVSKILGHRTINTTMRYLHLVQDHMASAINRGSLVMDETGGNTQSEGVTKSVTNVADPTEEHVGENEGKCV